MSQLASSATTRETLQQEDLSGPPAAKHHRLPDERASIVALGASSKVPVKKKFTQKQLLAFTAIRQSMGRTAAGNYILTSLGCNQ